MNHLMLLEIMGVIALPLVLTTIACGLLNRDLRLSLGKKLLLYGLALLTCAAIEQSVGVFAMEYFNPSHEGPATNPSPLFTAFAVSGAIAIVGSLLLVQGFRKVFRAL